MYERLCLVQSSVSDAVGAPMCHPLKMIGYTRIARSIIFLVIEMPKIHPTVILHFSFFQVTHLPSGIENENLLCDVG